MANSLPSDLQLLLREIKIYAKKIGGLLEKCQIYFTEKTIVNSKQITNQFQDIEEWIVQGEQLLKQFLKPLNEKLNMAANAINELIKDIDFISPSQIVQTQFLDYVYQIQTTYECREEYVQQFKLSEADEQIFKQIKGFQKVRGDGNCCYTSIFYQYLDYLINRGSEAEETQFLEQINEMNLSLFLEQKTVLKFPYQERSIKEYFLHEYNELKHHKNLLSLFQKQNRKFYTCAIVIFRNFIHKCYQKHSDEFQHFLASDIEHEILTWGMECNTNQVVLLLVAKELNIQITMFQFNKQQQTKTLAIQVSNFNEKKKNLYRINLLFRPGHYQIGIC